MVCTDVDEHRDQLRNVTAEFAKAAWATVIEPQYAWTFLRLSAMRIDAIVQAVLHEDDAVSQAARSLIIDLAPLEVAVVVCLLCCARNRGTYEVSLEDLESVSFIDDALKHIPDAPRDSFFFDPDEGEAPPDYAQVNRDRTAKERLGEALEVLDGGIISLNASSGTIFVNPAQTLAVEALMVDAMARFNLQGGEAARFVFDTLDVARTFNIDFDPFVV